MGEVIINLHNTVKIALSILLFGIVPLVAFLIFNFRPELFEQLDILKLILIVFGISSPIIFLNTAFLIFIIKPSNPELASRFKHDNPLGASLMLSTAISMVFAVVILVMCRLGMSESTAIWTLCGAEVVLLLILVRTIIQETL